MDSIPSFEFHKIFRRLSYDVDLKGAYTPEDIDDRLDDAKQEFRGRARRMMDPAKRKALYSKAKGIENLQDKGFARKTFVEAHENPYGIVNLTLHYGTQKAQQMKLAFERTRIRSGKVPRVEALKRRKLGSIR